MNTKQRPQSLKDVSVLAKDGHFDAFLREFIDEFDKASHEKKQQMILQEPDRLENPIAGAYLAATAEHLARKNKLLIPDWTNDNQYVLRYPHFGSPLQSHKAYLLARSPSAFRRRMIFVDMDVLSRPHKDNWISK